jgi:hypothetical protein
MVAGALGCGEAVKKPNEVSPGTLCYTIGAAPRTCIAGDALAMTETTTRGNLWFRVSGLLPLETKDLLGRPDGRQYFATLFGQIPEQVPLPRDADNVMVTVPVPGQCVSSHLYQLIGNDCKPTTVDTVCQPSAVYDPAVGLTVTAVGTGFLRAHVHGQLRLDLPSDCCRNEDRCNAPPPAPAFTPGSPFSLEADLYATFQ